MADLLRCTGPLGILACVLMSCGGHAPPLFPDHEALFAQSEYTHGGSAIPYTGRLVTNDGLIAYLKELDGHLALLRELTDARLQLAGLVLPASASRRDRQRVSAEQQRLTEESHLAGRLVRQFLDLAVSQKSFAVIPELREALRLARRCPIEGLDGARLLEHLRFLGSDSAACGAELDDPLQAAEPPPWYREAQKGLEDAEDGEVQLAPELRVRYQRITGSSPDQRRAMALYGPFRRITAVPGKKRGEVWSFQIGSVEGLGSGGSMSVDDRPRALFVECDYDARGRLRGARDEVRDHSGRAVDLTPPR